MITWHEFLVIMQAILLVFVGLPLILVAALFYRRAVRSDEAVHDEAKMAGEIAELKAENRKMREEISHLSNLSHQQAKELIVLKLDNANGKAERAVLVEVATELVRQIRELGAIPNRNVESLLANIAENYPS